MKTHLKVGDKLYAMIAPRIGRAPLLCWEEIWKLGSKFIYAGEYKIDKETLRAGTISRSIQFYKTEQELLDIEDMRKMRHEVDQKIRSWGFKATDDQIKAIHKILFPEDNENKSE